MTTELAVILLLLVGVGVYLLVEWADGRGA